MALRVRLFNRQGVSLAEVPCAVSRSWELNKPGMASLVFSLRDPKITPENLLFGNFVLIESDVVESWGGYLWPPRNWGRQTVACTAYSAESLLRWRLGPFHAKIHEGSGGSHFSRFLDLANSIQDTRIRPGEIWGGGKPVSVYYNQRPLTRLIEKLRKKTNCDYSMTPDFDTLNYLVFQGNWYQRRGIEHQDVWLMEGHNVTWSEEVMYEEGDIVTYIAAEALTSESAGTVYRCEDASDISKYGLWQDVKVVDQIMEEQALKDLAAALLPTRLEPNRRFRLSVTNRDGLFNKLGIGDIVRLKLRRINWADVDLKVRIIGKAFQEEEGTMPITVEEWEE